MFALQHDLDVFSHFELKKANFWNAKLNGFTIHGEDITNGKIVEEERRRS